jgi:hypothetical protein
VPFPFLSHHHFLPFSLHTHSLSLAPTHTT